MQSARSLGAALLTLVAMPHTTRAHAQPRTSGEKLAAKAPRVPSAFALPVAPERFAWSSPLAQRNDLHAVSGTADGQRIWAVGAMGTIVSLRGPDAALEATGTVADLNAIWVAAENDIWVVGDHGTILHGDGKRWSAVPSGTKQALYSIWGRSAHDLWIGGQDGTVLRRAGNRWRVVRVPTKGPIVSIAGCDGDAVCALTLAGRLPNIDLSYRPCKDPDPEGCPADEPQEPEGNRILRWSAGRWSTISPSAWVGIEPVRMTSAGTTAWVSNGNQISIVGAGRSDGSSVNLPKGAERVQVNGLWARREDDGWLVGVTCRQETPAAGFQCDGAIWRFDGVASALRPEVAAPALFAVWSWSKTGAVAVGERGTILRFDGDFWTSVSKPVTNADLRGVWSAPTTGDKHQLGPVVWHASSDDAEIRQATLALPGGSKVTWGLPKPAGAPTPPRSCGETDLWLIGDCEALRARDGGWQSYVTQPCEAQAATRKLLGFDLGEAWIVNAYRRASWDPGAPVHWDGHEWTTVSSPSARAPVDLWAADSNDIWFVGGRDIVRWDGQRLTFATPMPGLDATDGLTSIWGADAKNIWVVANTGRSLKLARWNGQRWSATATFGFDLPARFLPSDPWEPAHPWTGNLSSSRQVALWGTSTADVWLAGPNGIVLRFDGKAWWRVATPTRQSLLGIGGTPDHVVVVGEGGTILEVDRQVPAPAK